MQLRPRIVGREAPFDRFGPTIALSDIGGDDALERFFISQPLFQTHVRQYSEFDFGDVEPTAMLGRVMEFQLPGQRTRFVRRERFIQ